MKFILFALVVLSFIVISSLYISKEDKSLDIEIKSIKHPDISQLKKLHKKFLKLDIHSKTLNLSEAIKDIKEARKQYPLDDTLKMIEIELENKRANEFYKSTKD